MSRRSRRLDGNIAKYFFFLFTQRRNFFPLISIFFLTLPNTTAQQIGLFTGIGYLFSFFFEIPSSYFADRVGHKQTLLLSKFLMVLSSICFVFAQGFWYFVAGSVLLSTSLACSGGVGSAFMHETMRALRREKEYTKVMGRISGYVALLSAFAILALPFLTEISMRLPFQVWLVIDCIGLLIAFSFVAPPQEQDSKPHSLSSFIKTIRAAARPGFYPLAIFVGAIPGFLVADGAFRYVYLQSLGYPIIFIGFVMSLSRFVWFVVGHYIHYIERIPVHRLLLAEAFFFPLAYVLIAVFSNPYVVGFFFSIVAGYMWGRDQIYTTHIIKNFIVDARYKATMLSVVNQIADVFQMAIAFSIGFVMVLSYKLGFMVLGIAMFAILVFTYLWLVPYITPKRSRA